MALFTVICYLLFASSCAKDSDLFYEALEEQQEELLEEQTEEEPESEESENPEEESDSGNDDDSANRIPIDGGNPNFFDTSPAKVEPSDSSTYTPTSESDISNSSNAGKTAIISNSFSCNACTFAANQKIRPAGGVINGNNINLNGAYIDDVAEQAFASSVTFSTIYEDSWVYPEVFGANANDAQDDADAIDAAIKNVKFCRNVTNGTYVFNTPKFNDRKGDFIWDLNDGKLEITSDGNFDEVTEQQGLIWAFQLNIKVFDGEIDNNDLFGRVFRLDFPEAFHFENLWIHNLQNEGYSSSQGMRTIAIDVQLSTKDGSKGLTGGAPFTYRTTNNVFLNGYVVNNVIEDLSATGSGLPTVVAQAFWYQLLDLSTSNSGLIFHGNNIIRRINGEEAEGLYWDDKTFSRGKVENHLLTLQIENDQIYECGDRAIKATNGGVQMNNCFFGQPTVDVGRTLVEFFTQGNQTNTTNRTRNISITNCTFQDTRGNVCNFLSLGDVENVTITGNRFEYASSGNYSAIGLGTLATSPANGWAENILISGNTYINSGIELRKTLTTSNVIVENETFSWNHTGTGGGQTQALIRGRSNGSYSGFVFRNSNADINIVNSGNSFTGILFIDNSLANMDIDNINLSYSNNFSNSNGEVAYITGDFADSNSLTNVLLTNASGNGAIKIDGRKGPILTNSRDNNNIELSIK